MKILPYLRNHENQMIKLAGNNRNDNSDLTEQIRKNAWTNLPELLRQIALANAQKQQQAGGGTKIGYLQQVNTGDFVPSALASDNMQEDFMNGPQNRSPEQITSPMIHPRGNLGVRSQPKSPTLDTSTSVKGHVEGADDEDDKKHLLYHNIQMKNGGIKWTRGIFVKPGSHVPNDNNPYNSASNTKRFNSGQYNYEGNSKDRTQVHRQSAFTTSSSALPKSTSLGGGKEIYVNRNDSNSNIHPNIRLTNYGSDEFATALSDYNKHRYRPRRRNKYAQSLLEEIAPGSLL